MYEKVNPSHVDKVADRIAGAIVDLAYSQEKNPRIAVEVLIGHGKCHIIAETSVSIKRDSVRQAVKRIAGNVAVDYAEVPQDIHLAENQMDGIRCGDNGIFKGVPLTKEQKELARIARNGGLYEHDKRINAHFHRQACAVSEQCADALARIDFKVAFFAS